MATSEVVILVHDMVMVDRQVTKRYIASAFGISKETVHSFLMKDLDIRKLSACWVPRLLNVDQKHTRKNMSHANLNHFVTDPACDYG